jgi:hypothetical protein
MIMKPVSAASIFGASAAPAGTAATAQAANAAVRT